MKHDLCQAPPACLRCKLYQNEHSLHQPHGLGGARKTLFELVRCPS